MLQAINTKFLKVSHSTNKKKKPPYESVCVFQHWSEGTVLKIIHLLGHTKPENRDRPQPFSKCESLAHILC